MFDFIFNINFGSYIFVNRILQAICLELILALFIPVAGFIIEKVIVRFLQGLIRKAIGHKAEFVFSNYVLFPGVVIHELSHAFFAVISGAVVKEIVLFKPEGSSLGHVSYCTRGDKFISALQNSLCSAGPVISGILLSALIIFKVLPALKVTWQTVIASYILISIVFHMNMSSADLKNYFKGIPVLAMFMFPIVLVYVIFS